MHDTVFPLQKLVTLDDLERGSLIAVVLYYFIEFGSLGPITSQS